MTKTSLLSICLLRISSKLQRQFTSTRCRVRSPICIIRKWQLGSICTVIIRYRWIFLAVKCSMSMLLYFFEIYYLHLGDWATGFILHYTHFLSSRDNSQSRFYFPPTILNDFHKHVRFYQLMALFLIMSSNVGQKYY